MKKILSIVALLLMAVTGAWAQTEGLLTSITTNHSETITYSTAGCATLTTSGNVEIEEVDDEIYGWTNSSSYNGSLTVTPSEGYTITKVVFKGYDEDDGWFEAFTDTEALYTCYMKSSEVSLSETMDTPETDTYKICQIDVYGYSTVTANEGATGEYWATYYNGTTSFTADENTTVFQAALSGSSLTLKEVPNREIPATKAVILKSSSATITLTPASTTATLDGNALQGTATELMNPGNAYVLNKKNGVVGFYKLSSTGTIGANKAYLTYSGASLTRSFFGFDETTGIEMPTAEVIDADAVVYDLQGRRVAQPTKGLYIVNGKKVIIK